MAALRDSTTDLHNIVFGHRADDPGFIRVPGEVGYLGRVASVDEQQLRGAVLGVLSALLLSYLAQIPHVKAAICPAGGEDGFVMG